MDEKLATRRACRAGGRPPDPWRWRTRLVLVALIGGFLAVGTRLAYLQVVAAPELARRAERQQQRVVTIDAERGTVYDRRGRILAMNLDVPSVYAVPNAIDQPFRTAAALAKILGVRRDDLARQLSKDRDFIYVARRIDPVKAEKIKALRLKGIGFVEESRRFYPKKYLMGQSLGFAGLDNQGLEGVELKYDPYLRGEKGYMVVERDALGKTVFPKGFDYVAPERGKDLILTIDEVIQYITERELDKAMTQTRAASGTAVVMDPRTGEILAMAVRPQFNPNAIDARKPSVWRNRAITDPYEPGSTFKIVVASAALEEGVVSLSDRIYCEDGSMSFAGGRIHDVHKEGTLTFQEVIQKSSNIGTVKVGLRLGEDRLNRYLRMFGFGSKTGIDLPGESAGIVRDPSAWSKRSIASVAIGQEISVTPIQLITAAAVLANDGNLVHPHLVSEIRDDSGKTLVAFHPQPVRRVISAQTASRVRSILQSVVEKGGTGEKASIPGFTVAGKTGTAQKADPETGGYSSDRFVSSFVGFVPAEDPRLIALIVIDEPKGVAWGGSVAAPVFKAIAEQTLGYLEVPSSDPERVVLVSGE